MKFWVINGVNLNMTGIREQSVYGEKTLDEINAELKEVAENSGDEVEFFQSNIEGEICTFLQNAVHKDVDGILLNAGAYTHYSIAIRDAVKSIDKPVLEIHMSNVFAREDFRKESMLLPVCVGSICGLKEASYVAGLVGLKKYLEGANK